MENEVPLFDTSSRAACGVWRGLSPLQGEHWACCCLDPASSVTLAAVELLHERLRKRVLWQSVTREAVLSRVKQPLARHARCLPSLGIGLEALPCSFSLQAMNLKSIREGEKKSNTEVKGGVNPCGFWAGKHASSSFRELRVSRGMQHFVLWASVSLTQPALSCWSLPAAGFGPDWSLLDGNQGKGTWISVLKQQGETPPLVQIPCVSVDQGCQSPHTWVHLQVEVAVLPSTFLGCLMWPSLRPEIRVFTQLPEGGGS